MLLQHLKLRLLHKDSRSFPHRLGDTVRSPT
jgi:hypothetical protein